jgi:hypothetical protein
MFAMWWQHHGSTPVKVADLHRDIIAIINPQGRGRQYVATKLKTMNGTRTAGYVLSRQEAAGNFAAATYQLTMEQ